MNFALPPLQKNEEGQVRKVGFELEFSGLDLGQTASIIFELFGGEHVVENSFLHRIENTRVGDFSVEIDAAIFKEQTYLTYLQKLGIDLGQFSFQDNIDKILSKIAATVVPCEIVTPPIPMTELGKIEKLREALHAKEAQGTRASLIHAFGLHINPEVPATDAATLLNYLRAFLLLYDWIYTESSVDWSRRITPFINEFPKAYSDLILDPDYAPDLEGLIDDYLEHNPTRNRPLDMLPVFAFLDQERVSKGVADEASTQPRPAFHYRLPNCVVGDPDWRIAHEWNRWVEVEKLAVDPERIRQKSSQFLAGTASPRP